ncbi:iron complex transport system permease protein [Haloactinospora alba]|uniref:Iron complex transport system permease protein n=1 Tax=Haloactinospora alba TaxID=405555 RepID=A0A543NEB4_9ACTN|nr:iron chelate uptake ABC transporter family permease subunit [Haloactinospora alba]TQN30173.1 iron complex transport system permease protein [Haloactinospora alba]
MAASAGTAAAPRRVRARPPGAWIVRARAWDVSLRLDAPALTVGTAMAALAAAALVLSLTMGDFPVEPREVVRALTGGTADPMVNHIVVQMRLPRALTAAGVGAALAMSGMLLQRLAHNPLVSPDVIGINAGAAAAATAAIAVLGGTALQVAGFALGGAVATAVLLYLLAYQRGVSGNRLVLLGIGVSAVLGSVTSYMITRADIDTAQRATVWLTGSLANRDWAHVATIAAALAVLTPLALGLSRQLRLLQLGDDLAVALGGRVRLARGGLLLTAAGFSALATAVAGPVAFVALAAPQIVRRLLAERAVGILPAAGCGAVLVLLSDALARTGFGGGELPVGVVTGILGAPYLLYLLARSNRTRG